MVPREPWLSSLFEMRVFVLNRVIGSPEGAKQSQDYRRLLATGTLRSRRGAETPLLAMT